MKRETSKIFCASFLVFVHQFHFSTLWKWMKQIVLTYLKNTMNICVFFSSEFWSWRNCLARTVITMSSWSNPCWQVVSKRSRKFKKKRYLSSKSMLRILSLMSSNLLFFIPIKPKIPMKPKIRRKSVEKMQKQKKKFKHMILVYVTAMWEIRQVDTNPSRRQIILKYRAAAANIRDRGKSQYKHEIKS